MFLHDKQHLHRKHLLQSQITAWANEPLRPSPYHLETAGLFPWKLLAFWKLSEYVMRTEVAERKSIPKIQQGRQKPDIYLSHSPAGGQSILVTS